MTFVGANAIKKLLTLIKKKFTVLQFTPFQVSVNIAFVNGVGKYSFTKDIANIAAVATSAWNSNLSFHIEGIDRGALLISAYQGTNETFNGTAWVDIVGMVKYK